MDLGNVEGIVGLYKSTANFQEFSNIIKPTVQSFLSRFEEIARACPEQDRDVATSMVRHESAILKWLVMESEGNTEGSLDDMIGELQYPLPKLILPIFHAQTANPCIP